MIFLWHILCPFNIIHPTSPIPTLTLILTFKLFTYVQCSRTCNVHVRKCSRTYNVHVRKCSRTYNVHVRTMFIKKNINNYSQYSN